MTGPQALGGNGLGGITGQMTRYLTHDLDGRSGVIIGRPTGDMRREEYVWQTAQGM